MTRSNRSKSATTPPRAQPARDRHRSILGIRLIVTSVAVAITSVAVLAVGAVQERNSRQALTAEITLRLLLQARNLALTSSPALLTDLPELTLHPLVKEMLEEQPELAFVVVADHQGIIQGHADARLLGTKHELPADLVAEPASADLAPGEELRGNQTTLIATAPVLYPGGEVIGTAAVGLPRTYIEGAVAAARRQQSLVLAIVLAVGVAATLGFMTGLLRPVAVLRAGLERIGQGDLDSPIRLRNRTEFGMLADTVDEMAAQLKRAQAEMLEKERMSRELELARQIQQSLLPKSRTLSGQFVIEGAHTAASEVGGDYYDVLPLTNGRLGLAVADVAGKGLAGCLAMSMLAALLRAFRNEELTPSELLAKLDERLGESLQRGSFVTMFYGVLDPRTGLLTFASAGHLPPFFYRAATREIQWFPTEGIPLAAVRGGAIRRTLKDQVVQLDPGDLLLQYTDGVNEAFDATGEKQFDFARIADTLKAAAPEGAAAVLREFRKALADWRGGSARHDDETILIASREVCVLVAAPAPTETEVSPHLLEDARRRGERLNLSSRLDELDQLLPWVASRPALQAVPTRARDLVATALYEACANIAEHGYDEADGRSFDLWWVDGATTPAVPGAGGYFLIHDHGRPYRPADIRPNDFEDPAVRKRLRGFGLEIIHRVMSRVVYQPATKDGNLTYLAFDAVALELNERELRHA